MKIETKFDIEQMVNHVLDNDSTQETGMIVAIMVRGKNTSYQVQWRRENEASWHMEYELREVAKKPPIGFSK